MRFHVGFALFIHAHEVKTKFIRREYEDANLFCKTYIKVIRPGNGSIGEMMSSH